MVKDLSKVAASALFTVRDAITKVGKLLLPLPKGNLVFFFFKVCETNFDNIYVLIVTFGRTLSIININV